MEFSDIRTRIMPIIEELWTLDGKARPNRLTRQRLGITDFMPDIEFETFMERLPNRIDNLFEEQEKDYKFYHSVAVIVINHSNLDNRDEVALPYYMKSMQLWEGNPEVSPAEKGKMCSDICITYGFLSSEGKGITPEEYTSMIAKAFGYYKEAFECSSDEFAQAVVDLETSLISVHTDELIKLLYELVSCCRGDFAFLANLLFAKTMRRWMGRGEIELIDMALERLRIGFNQLNTTHLRPYYTRDFDLPNPILLNRNELENDFTCLIRDFEEAKCNCKCLDQSADLH